MKVHITRIQKLALPVALLFAIGMVPLAGKASQINETFTISVFPAQTLPATFFGSSVAEFNPADGTLQSIGLSLSGPATWTSSASVPLLLVQVSAASGAVSTNCSAQTFSAPGIVPVDDSCVTSDPSVLQGFTGTGTAIPLLSLVAGESNDTFETSGLSGTLTYNYTPATAAEPGSLALLGMVLAGFGIFALVRRSKGPIGDCS